VIGVNQGGHNDWNVLYFVVDKFRGIAILLNGRVLSKQILGAGGGVQGWVDWSKCLSRSSVTDVGMSVVPTEGGGRRNQ
jgi:hypothetical protein